jgi:carbamoyl-phosphate synthase large subunit
MTELRVLLSSGGRRFGLIDCFRQSLVKMGIAGLVYVADCSPSAPTCQLADKAWQVCSCTGLEFAPELLRLAEREDVRIILPTIDAELPILSECRNAFAKRGARVFVSDPRTVQICADKLLTHEWLSTHGFPTVRQSTPEAILANLDDWAFPLIVKPRDGSGSLGVRQIRCKDELELVARLEEGMIAQEIATGQEHTINIFVNAAGKCVCAVPHHRLEVRAGEVSKAVTVKHAPMMELARRVAESLPGAYGPMNIQCFLSSEGIRVIEINARIGGGYPLAHRAGAHFTRWMIEDVLGLPSTAAFEEWEDDLAMLRYDHAVFLPAARIRPNANASPTTHVSRV